MRVLTSKALQSFWEKHSAVRTPLMEWLDKTEKADWKTASDVRKTFGTVDSLAVNQILVHIFNISGNDYRLITVIHLNCIIVHTRTIYT
ncbi:MAG: type II toxin-antitoxin system HigB family toxin [bacterium]|jgi:mRNA-degrading endonuclease HigB of HigAB toxin-antitoxin module